MLLLLLGGKAYILYMPLQRVECHPISRVSMRTYITQKFRCHDKKLDKKQDFSEIFSLCLACVVLRNHRLPKMAMHGCFVAGITLEKNNIFFQGWYVTKKQALQIGVNKCNLFAGRRVVHNRYWYPLLWWLEKSEPNKNSPNGGFLWWFTMVWSKTSPLP